MNALEALEVLEAGFQKAFPQNLQFVILVAVVGLQSKDNERTRAKHIGFLLSLDVGNYKLVTNEYIEPTVKICLMDWSDNK